LLEGVVAFVIAVVFLIVTTTVKVTELLVKPLTGSVAVKVKR
jgi:hypothetical protein